MVPLYIFNGSIFGSLGQAGQAAYAASKAGLRGMARSLATDLAPRRIRVNVVAPGATKTPIWGRNPLSLEQADALTQRITATIPLGRWAEADEIAKVVLSLASDDSSYVNSVELYVDGGTVGSPFGGAAFRSA